MHANIEQFNQFTSRFQQIFGVPLTKYFHPLFGFDLIRFDEQFVQSGNNSMRDEVKRRWGDEAVTLILELIA